MISIVNRFEDVFRNFSTTRRARTLRTDQIAPERMPPPTRSITTPTEACQVLFRLRNCLESIDSTTTLLLSHEGFAGLRPGSAEQGRMALSQKFDAFSILRSSIEPLKGYLTVPSLADAIMSLADEVGRGGRFNALKFATNDRASLERASKGIPATIDALEKFLRVDPKNADSLNFQQFLVSGIIGPVPIY